LRRTWGSMVEVPCTLRSAIHIRFDLGKVPKAFVQTVGMVPTRDSGIMHAYALDVAGVDVRLLAYGDMPHEFPVTLSKRETSKEGAY
jgi:acetyl esterase/lipase